jgi:hypothetical protein
MPPDFLAIAQKDDGWSSEPAQQEIGGAGTPMARLGRGDREYMPPQFRRLQPAWNRAFYDPRSARPKSAPGDDKNAPPSRIARRSDEGGEFPMRLGLGQSVQIETCLDFVQTTFQPLGVRAVDPGKVVECRQYL